MLILPRDLASCYEGSNVLREGGHGRSNGAREGNEPMYGKAALEYLFKVLRQEGASEISYHRTGLISGEP